ncbi:GSCOCT00007852001.2-RA-CDS [Cotesia congregata]|uniref:Cc_K425_438 n=1 Tax=Cotesia congregata TaxID=51543 RepID=A0A8J2MJH7_COTCN|nr:GSCOCT00007852001.2-RA-CDS [Cotesia congregata]CAG5090008.1 Cc_K425_438 [Cotesia congregata]
MFSLFHGRIDGLNNLHDSRLDITDLKKTLMTDFEEKLSENNDTFEMKNFSNLDNTKELVSIERTLFNKLINKYNNCKNDHQKLNKSSEEDKFLTELKAKVAESYERQTENSSPNERVNSANPNLEENNLSSESISDNTIQPPLSQYSSDITELNDQQNSNSVEDNSGNGDIDNKTVITIDTSTTDDL